ncbi:MAG: DNA primase [Akkermansiaceae bacterium]|nr:DNA primase [Akkermansiaceae bacterium]MCP5547730.1 DNA primase [Akkermansiaceae bacterium]
MLLRTADNVAQISKENIEQVLSSIDIVELVQSYLPLKRAGSQYRANCPFHSEKTPSFYVNPARQSFHCFGCGKGGDAITFVRDYENLPFIEALRKLAQRTGVPLREEAEDPAAERARRSRGRLLDLLRETTEFMHNLLLKDPAAQHAREYLKSRGYGSPMAKSWQVGWMPPDTQRYTAWVKSRKFSGRELVDSGMAYMIDESRPAAGIRVRFRDRLMFPIRNEIGDVIGFSGRQLREDKNSGKYINSPETPVFRKSRVLFGLDRAKKPILKAKCALLCEGQLDVIACHEAGVEHAIASQGTAFTRDHANLLKRYTKQVVICYDADSAGLSAAERAFRELAAEGVTVKVARMPKGDDPDTFLQAHGADAFRAMLDDAAEFFDFKFGRMREEGVLESAAGRAAALADCAGILSTMGDFASRENQINVVATHLQTSAAALRSEISRLRKRAANNPRAAERRDEAQSEQGPAEPTRMHRIIAFMCHLALSSAPAQNLLGEQFETLHEAAPWLEGVPVLESILSSAPDPQSPAAVNSFLAAIPEPDRLALSREVVMEGAPEDGLQAAEHALALLSATVLQKRDAAVKAELKQPGLSHERMLELLETAKEISSLLRGVGQRSEFDDELPKSTYKPKQPEWKKKWRDRETKE